MSGTVTASPPRYPSAVPARWPGAARRLARAPLPLVLWLELLSGGALVAAVRRDATLLVVGFALAGTIVVGLGRRRGVPLYRLATTWWRYRLRRRSAPPPFGGVASLLPALHVTSAPLRAERRFGVCFDGTGWTAVLEIEAAGSMLVPATWPVTLPVPLLASLLAIDDIRLSSVQVLVRTVPAPVDQRPTGSPAVRSYRRIRPVGVAALRQTWIALRLDAGPAQDAIAARGGGVDGAHRALKRVTGRALELLEAAGIRARALDELALADVLTVTLLGGVPGQDPDVDPAARTLERWGCWQTGDQAQLTWWLAGWPPGQEPVEQLVQLLAAVQPRFGVVSFALHAAGDGGVRARVLVRAEVPLAELPAVADAFESAGRTTGVDLRRLDGEHGPGVAATLPLGGGAR